MHVKGTALSAGQGASTHGPDPMLGSWHAASLDRYAGRREL
jgi:hypothetical protein